MLSLDVTQWLQPHITNTMAKGGDRDGGNNATKLGMDSKHNFNNWDILPDKGAL